MEASTSTFHSSLVPILIKDWLFFLHIIPLFNNNRCLDENDKLLEGSSSQQLSVAFLHAEVQGPRDSSLQCS